MAANKRVFVSWKKSREQNLKKETLFQRNFFNKIWLKVKKKKKKNMNTFTFWNKKKIILFSK